MTIYQRMEEVFRVADVPGFLQAWQKTDEFPELPSLYAVYNLTRERTAQSADDAEIFRRYDVTVWVYGTEDVTEAVAAIEDAMALDGIEVHTLADSFTRLNGDHVYLKTIQAIYIDFGDYGAD